MKLEELKKIYEHNCSTPSDIHEHCPILYGLAKKCDHITEFGTRWGVSTSALLYAQPKKLVCYDLSRHKMVSTLNNVAGETEFVFIKGDTTEIEIEETDLLFIDTWHAYSQLKTELELHGNKANKYIAMHDTEKFGDKGDTVKGTRPPQQGLKPAIKEFITDNLQWKIWKHFKNNNGLTILRRTNVE